jgi:ATP-dependent Lhr-like helicase
VIYVTPLRAVSRDIEKALKRPVVELGLAVRVESRTGDTSSTVRARQKEALPEVLVTTPESLTLMMTWEDARERFKTLRCVIVDEWHELLSTKRGTQTELALARLRGFAEGMRTWALSATLENLGEAAEAVTGRAAERHNGTAAHGERVEEAGSLLRSEQRSRAPGTEQGTRGGGEGEGEEGKSIRISEQILMARGEEKTGPERPRPKKGGEEVEGAYIISARLERPVTIRTVIPSRPGAFPWAGHLGLSMLPDVIASLDPARATLLFTNTRSQAELWHQALLAAKPEWAAITGLHHGSVDRAERERVEAGLKDGSVRLVVATSSLDLGVDFAPVEEVYQIGSPKGIARILQRAGRSGHRPGAPCRVTCVPTHGLELIEIDAVRRAVATGRIEPRTVVNKPLDVLAQHLVSCGLGGGFEPDAMYEEVRSAYSYRELTREEFDWTLKLVAEGGATLWAYPEYRKLSDENGKLKVTSEKIGQMHKLNIGTIVSDATMNVSMTGGKRLGSIEEHFISYLKPGDAFLFAGRALEFIRVRDLTAYVKPARSTTRFTPRWGGTKLPISESLGRSVRESLQRASEGARDSAELQAAAYIVDAQQKLSIVPRADELLVETCLTREGRHVFFYPFEGRLVHLGLAAILSLRLSRLRKATYSIAANDYGFELLTARENDVRELLSKELFSGENVFEDAIASVNVGELSRAQFREVARVAGLVFTAYPGVRKTARQIHANSSLLFDVFNEFDPGNLLLEQARREVMDRQFERGRLSRAMDRLHGSVIRTVEVATPTPLGFPLIIEREGGTLSSQTILERVQAMRVQWDSPQRPGQVELDEGKKPVKKQVRKSRAKRPQVKQEERPSDAGTKRSNSRRGGGRTGGGKKR